MDAKQIYEKVQECYSSAAKSTSSEYELTIARGFGYTDDELANIPRDANLGLSCGNPLALAKLRENEIVIDLGSGAGFDVFLAAKQVGANGKAFGVDMNKEMLERAHRNKEKAAADNVYFVESIVTNIALPDAIADCVISNCVVNLVPEEEKQLAFNEMFRLLKPGGRVAISDILIRKELTQELKKNMALYVGCVAGASQVQEYENYLRKAGFNDVLIVDSERDLSIYTETNEDGTKKTCFGSGADNSCSERSPSCCNVGETTGESDLKSFRPNYKNIELNEWAGSFQVYAVKLKT